MIPIGVTARNEANNILALLASLRTAIDLASTELGCEYEIHVLLNDNDDHTAELLKPAKDVVVWNTYGGIIEAQRMLADSYRGRVEFLVFSDADIDVEPAALLEITRVMLACPDVQVAYAEKSPIRPIRQLLLAKALYNYNLREGYQTTRHYFNGQFFAIRNWDIPKRHELKWDPAADNPFLNLAAGIRVDDIYLSRHLLRNAGPEAIRCVTAGIRYRPPETLQGMFRKYQRMRLEIERLHYFFPDSIAAHRRWGQRRLDTTRLRTAPFSEQFLYVIFWLALGLCKIGYHAQRIYYTHWARQACPTWRPVIETKEPIE